MCHSLQLKKEKGDKLESNLDRTETIYKSYQIYSIDASPESRIRCASRDTTVLSSNQAYKTINIELNLVIIIFKYNDIYARVYWYR